MPRTSPSREDAKAISRRLKEFAQGRFGTWERFYTQLHVKRTTAVAWCSKDPSVPDAAALLDLARKTNLSLNWLLLGEGPELRIDPPRGDLDADKVEAVIQAELRQSGGADGEQEFEGAWMAMKVREDFTQFKRPDVILHLAVEGVRPRFDEALRAVRHYAKFARVMNTLPAAAEHAGNPARAAKIRQLFREIGVPLINVNMPEASAESDQDSGQKPPP